LEGRPTPFGDETSALGIPSPGVADLDFQIEAGLHVPAEA